MDGFFNFCCHDLGYWRRECIANLTIGRSFGALDAMRVNDVAINGVNLAASSALDDARSPAANAAASAIAKVASINATTAATGVSAVVGKTVFVGAAQSGVAAQVGTSTGTLSINGYVSATITSVEGNPRASRAAVLDAINRMSSKTGVVAVDTGTDLTGVRLEAADGRNIELAFNTESTAADFSARTGLKQGVQSASYSLQAKVETAINITAPSAGVIGRSGLQAGNFADNVAVVSGMARAPVQAATAQSQSVTLGGTVAVSDSFSITVNGKLKTFTATATNIENVRAGLIAAINADGTLGVSAANGGSLNELQLAASVPGTAFTCVVSKSSAAGTLATAELVANAAAQGSNWPHSTPLMKTSSSIAKRRCWPKQPSCWKSSLYKPSRRTCSFRPKPSQQPWPPKPPMPLTILTSLTRIKTTPPRTT